MPQSDEDDTCLRVSRGGDRLAAIASLLDVPVESFFPDAAAVSPACADASVQAEIGTLHAFYLGLQSRDRSALLAFARSLADADRPVRRTFVQGDRAAMDERPRLVSE